MRRERRVWWMMVLMAGILAAAGSVSGCASAKLPPLPRPRRRRAETERWMRAGAKMQSGTEM